LHEIDRLGAREQRVRELTPIANADSSNLPSHDRVFPFPLQPARGTVISGSRTYDGSMASASIASLPLAASAIPRACGSANSPSCILRTTQGGSSTIFAAASPTSTTSRGLVLVLVLGSPSSHAPSISGFKHTG